MGPKYNTLTFLPGVKGKQKEVFETLINSIKPMKCSIPMVSKIVKHVKNIQPQIKKETRKSQSLFSLESTISCSCKKKKKCLSKEPHRAVRTRIAESPSNNYTKGTTISEKKRNIVK